MREKLKKLSEILKQNIAIKERLERLEFGCWIQVEGYIKNRISIKNPMIGKLCKFTNPYYGGHCFNYYLKFNNRQEVVLCGSNFCKIIGQEPQYSDILEYLGGDYYLDKDAICEHGNFGEGIYGIMPVIFLSPGPLCYQSDETLEEIISLCKNVGK